MSDTLLYYCISASALGGLLSILTILFYLFGKSEHVQEEGKYKIVVRYKKVEFSASFLQTIIVFALSLVPVPLILVLYTTAIKTIEDPLDKCNRYIGKYYLDVPYLFVDSDIQMKNSSGIRARALEGTFEAKFCKKEGNGKVSLEGTETTIHSLEVKLRNSEKYIHARRFKSTYDSHIVISKDGEFEGRFIRPESQSPIGQKDDTKEDQDDYEKKYNTGEITAEDKNFITDKIKEYETMTKDSRTSLGKKHCAVTSGSEGGRDIIAFTCLDRYTRVLKRST